MNDVSASKPDLSNPLVILPILLIMVMALFFTVCLSIPTSEEKINYQVEAYFNKQHLDPRIRYLYAQQVEPPIGDKTIRIRLTLHDGKTMSFQVAPDMKDGFNDLDLWCRSEGKCISDASIDVSRLSQPEAQRLFGTFIRQANTVVAKTFNQEPPIDVDAENSRKSWNL